MMCNIFIHTLTCRDILTRICIFAKGNEIEGFVLSLLI